MRKPLMKNASVVKSRDRYRELIESGVSEEVARFVARREGKELNSQDIGINSRFKILDDCTFNDYDSLSPSDLCMFSSDYGEAKADLLANYIGKTLRVVARTGEETAPYGTRYYFFTVDK